jgi:hypothetical protein
LALANCSAKFAGASWPSLCCKARSSTAGFFISKTKPADFNIACLAMLVLAKIKD